ncbi:MAG TPA: superoxide dismutase family protein [Terrimicrobiaceae bacterium]
MKKDAKLTGMITALVLTAGSLVPSLVAEKATDEAMDSAPVIVDATELVAVLSPTVGNQAAGVVTFKSVDKGKVEVEAKLSGLTPNSKHAIHIHQYGDLTSKDGKSAGDHYNPMDHQHALPDKKNRHAGDFGNLESDQSGNASFKLIVDNISLAGRLNPIIGRGVVVHAKPDDGSQPSGNAGDRIAVGVIGVRNPKD